MGATSKIQWTDATWNVAVGCRKVDEDCKYCYMYRESLNGTRYDPKQIRRTTSVFNGPLKWREPKLIFTSSLTDVFLPEIDSYRNEIWDIIRHCPQHTFQILTKRPERIMGCLPEDWGDGWTNVWLGASVGSMKSFHRVSEILSVPARVRFISFEPLHGRVDMNIDLSDLCRLDWAIIGGESGNKSGQYRYRPCNIEWIEELMQDLTPTTPIFVKQLGTHLATELHLKDRHGGDIDEWPAHLQVREMPVVYNKQTTLFK